MTHLLRNITAIVLLMLAIAMTPRAHGQSHVYPQRVESMLDATTSSPCAYHNFTNAKIIHANSVADSARRTSIASMDEDDTLRYASFSTASGELSLRNDSWSRSRRFRNKLAAILARRGLLPRPGKLSHSQHRALVETINKIQGYAVVGLFGLWAVIASFNFLASLLSRRASSENTTSSTEAMETAPADNNRTIFFVSCRRGSRERTVMLSRDSGDVI